jgi:hypothetical protein
VGSPVQNLVTDVYKRYLDERSGEILGGIPALEDTDPEGLMRSMINAGALVARAPGPAFDRHSRSSSPTSAA